MNVKTSEGGSGRRSFITYTFHQIKEDGRDGACSTYGSDEERKPEGK